MPTGIDLSELPRTAYAEHLAGGGRPYPSRRALRAAEQAAAGAAGPPGAGFPGAVGIDTRPRPPDAGTPDGAREVPDDAEASGGPAADGAGSTASVMQSSALMAAGTLVSRILGMARAVILTGILGTSLTGDAFQVANTLPNNLYILIAGGALNAVLVPQISRAMKQGAAGREYVDRLLSVSMLLLGVASLVITAAAPVLVLLYGKELRGTGAFPLAVAFAFWCLPQVFFYGLYTLLGQVLNARGSFGPYMWAPVVNNVVAISGMLCFASVMGRRGDLPAPEDWSFWQVMLFAGTATLGVAAQALVLVPVLRRSNFSFRFRWGFTGVGLGTASKVAGWTFAAVAVGQMGYLVASNVAVFGGKEAAAAGKAGAGVLVYGNAYLMFVLPHSLVAVSLVTAIFTRMSRNATEGRRDAVRADLSLGLRTVGVATVLASAAFLVLGRDIAYVLFALSTREEAQPTGLVATAMTFGLVAYSAQYLTQRVFYAFEDARTPFVVQVVQTVVWIIGNLVARYTLHDISIVVGAGFALAVSLVVGAVLSLVLAGSLLGGVDGPRVLRTHVRLVVGAVLAAIAGWSVKVAVAAFMGTGRPAAAVGLVAAGLVMTGIYVAVLKVLQVRELDDLVAPIVGRLRRG
jgi:putative peptidoglycan lipid II flippase